MSRRILISGASVAGNTAAWWLGRYGFDVTVVEQTPDFRDGGQNVDVRGVGREVLRRMGLEQAALDLGTGEQGTTWVDQHGKTKAEFITDATTGDGMTAEMEILRGDLARLIYEPARERAKYRFGTRIERIEDGPEYAEITFTGGDKDRFDMLIVAEGVGSNTRELVFPGENNARWMDLAVAFFTIPRTPDDNRMWRWYNATRGRSISLRPDQHGTTRATLSIQKRTGGEEKWEASRQKAWLGERFADAGWQALRVLEGMEQTADFYFDALRQVRMDRWSNGHVVLTGDAAWCVTPLAGIGTTLALTGAYVLAAELQRAGSITEAHACYETAMRPMVQHRQGVPKIGPRLMNPHTRVAIKLLHGVLNLASKPAVRKLARKLFNGSHTETEVDLSRYQSFGSNTATLDVPTPM